MLSLQVLLFRLLLSTTDTLDEHFIPGQQLKHCQQVAPARHSNMGAATRKYVTQHTARCNKLLLTTAALVPVQCKDTC
jgi:hypothetical protein